MSIKIKQVDNLKQKFEVYIHNQVKYCCQMSGLTPYWDITLRTLASETVLKSSFKPNIQILNVLPRGIFHRKKLSRQFNFTNGVDEGYFVFVKQGWLTTWYEISFAARMIQVYSIHRGDWEYLSVFEGTNQIAQVDRKIFAKDFLDEYDIHLLKSKSDLLEILILFTLYYDRWNQANRGKLMDGRFMEKEWSFSTTNKYYNQNWLKKENHDCI